MRQIVDEDNSSSVREVMVMMIMAAAPMRRVAFSQRTHLTTEKSTKTHWHCTFREKYATVADSPTLVILVSASKSCSNTRFNQKKFKASFQLGTRSS
jgi:hypothetical protein